MERGKRLMGKFIDLSWDIFDNMAVYPSDNPVKLHQDKFLEKDGYNYFQLEIGLHAGTHIDTPMHMLNDKTFISGVPLDRFTGKGCLLDVRGERVIGFKQEYSNIINSNDIVILFTGYRDGYGTEEYFLNHPVVGEDLADFFVEKKIKMLGMDLPSPDRYPFGIHKKLLKNNILLIENLTNLAELVNVKSFTIYAFPLKIRADASIARVVACIDMT
jgi:kynurenine formamidase